MHTWLKQCWIHCGFASINQDGICKGHVLFGYWSLEWRTCACLSIVHLGFYSCQMFQSFPTRGTFLLPDTKNNRGERWQEMHSQRSHRAGEMTALTLGSSVIWWYQIPAAVNPQWTHKLNLRTKLLTGPTRKLHRTECLSVTNFCICPVLCVFV